MDVPGEPGDRPGYRRATEELHVADRARRALTLAGSLAGSLAGTLVAAAMVIEGAKRW